MDERVIVKNMVRGMISLNIPSMHFRRIWQKKGAKLPIEKSVLREAIYDPGVENMFRSGVLYIEDMDFKIELGLEQPGTKEPTQIPHMDDKYMTRILTLMPISEARECMMKMSEVQKQELVDFACGLNNINMDRVSAIEEICGTNILKVVSLHQEG